MEITFYRWDVYRVLLTTVPFLSNSSFSYKVPGALSDFDKKLFTWKNEKFKIKSSLERS